MKLKKSEPRQLYYRSLKFPVSTSVYLFIALVALIIALVALIIALVALWENGLTCRIVMFSQSVWVYGVVKPVIYVPGCCFDWPHFYTTDSICGKYHE
jgi:hypothetical protein